MSADVHDFPNRVVRTTGGGPGDPMIERRVATLEAAVGDIRTFSARIEVRLERHEEAFRRIEDALKVLADVREKVAHIDGRLANIPTFWQMLALIGTLLIGLSGLIFIASRFLHS